MALNVAGMDGVFWALSWHADIPYQLSMGAPARRLAHIPGGVDLRCREARRGVIFRPEVGPGSWGAERFFVWDCWASRDLGSIGFQHEWKSTWYVRPPSSQAKAFEMPPELSIEIVASTDQLADFEQATWEGFVMAKVEDPESKRFSQHALTTLDDAGMVYLNARFDGRVVVSTIVHASDGIAGIYGLSTVPAFRRRGYATALVRTAVNLNPELPTCVLQPDPPSIPIYTGSGFVPARETRSWAGAVYDP